MEATICAVVCCKVCLLACLPLTTRKCWKGTHPLFPKSWQHIAVSFDAVEHELKFFVNGRLNMNIEVAGSSIHICTSEQSENWM